MAARDEGRALAAIQKLKDEQIGDWSVHWLNLNLSDPRLAKKAGDEFIQLEKRLDILGESFSTVTRTRNFSKILAVNNAAR